MNALSASPPGTHNKSSTGPNPPPEILDRSQSSPRNSRSEGDQAWGRLGRRLDIRMLRGVLRMAAECLAFRPQQLTIDPRRLPLVPRQLPLAPHRLAID